MNQWTFNEDVANNFDYIADTSIPKYRIILYKTLEMIKCYPKNVRILEIGCANGNMMSLLKNNGYNNVIGIDTSPSMIQKCKSKGLEVFLVGSRFPTQFGKFDIIISNWTIHFISDISSRVFYLDDVYNNLNDSGTFILSEKVNGDISEYYNFKRSNFLSDEEIKQKSESLKNVLITVDENLYLKLFNDIGFKEVDIIDKTFCFRTFVLKK